MNNDKKKILIFDKLNYTSLYYLQSADDVESVYFFQSSGKKTLDKMKILASTKKFDFFDLDQMECPFTLYISQIKAHDEISRIYHKFVENKKATVILKFLYGSQQIELVYKREFLDFIQSQYVKENMIDYVVSYNNYSENSNVDVLYYSEFNYSLYGIKSLFSSKVKIAEKSIFFGLSCIKDKFREYIKLFFPLYLIARSFGGIKSGKDRKEFRVGINMNLPSILDRNYPYFYYFIDSLYGIKKDDLLFIDERYDSNFSSNALNCYSIYERMPFSFGCIGNLIFHFFGVWIFCLIFCIFQNTVFIRSTRKILSDYIKWNLFFDRFELKNYVNVLMPDNPSKCIIFQKNNVGTYFIYPDNYTDDYHTDLDEKILAQTYFCFMKYDHAIVYGDKTKRYFEKSKNIIGSYKKLGVIHSQRVCEIKSGIVDKKLDSNNLFIKKPEKIISVFDIAFVNWGFMHKGDAIKFAESIYQLLEDFEDIGIIFKEKKDISQYPDLYAAYNKIGEHPRGAYIQKNADQNIYSFDVIAESDMVISACFTSTHAEALCSKTRAVYYDSKGDYIGDNYYFNKFPDMVAHDYEELKVLVKKWLFETDDSEFESYLETYVKGEIDEYLDQKAIERLVKEIYGI